MFLIQVVLSLCETSSSPSRAGVGTGSSRPSAVPKYHWFSQSIGKHLKNKLSFSITTYVDPCFPTVWAQTKESGFVKALLKIWRVWEALLWSLVWRVELRKVNGIKISIGFPSVHPLRVEEMPNMSDFCHYLDVVNALDIIFWLFWPFCTSVWEEVGILQICYPKWPKQPEHPETLVWEVPVILSKHCMPFLHKSSWGALAFWRLVGTGSCHHFDHSLGMGIVPQGSGPTPLQTVMSSLLLFSATK